MRNLPVRKYTPAYTLPYRNYSQSGLSTMVKRSVQGLVVIGASYVGLQIVLGVFGFVLSAVGYLLPVGVLSAIVYGGWQWLKNR